jgi:hypothetical protein
MIMRNTRERYPQGGGWSALNGNSWDVDAVGESVDMVDGSNQVHEAYGELLGYPSTHLH